MDERLVSFFKTMTPYIHPFLRVKASPIHGLGVFTSGSLPKGLEIERAGILSIGQDVLPDYTFGWPQNSKWEEFVIALGYGSYYNHSSEPNIEWISDEVNRLLVFRTLREIAPGEELLSNYGDSYWVDKEPK